MAGLDDSDEWLDNLKALAEELNTIPSGSILHYDLLQILEDWQFSRAEVDNTYTILLSFFLGSLQGKGVSTDVAQLTTQVMQARAPTLRFTHPITTPSGSSEPQGANSSAARGAQLGHIIQSLRYSSIARPSTHSAEGRGEAVPDMPPETAPSSQGGTTDPFAYEAPAAPRPAERVEEEALHETFPELEMLSQPEAEERVNSAYRMHLDRKHGEIEKLQNVLSQKAMEAITQNKAFGDLLEIERSALQQASSITEIGLLKEILIGGTDELIDGQRELAEKLESSFQYLQLVKSDSERLHDELHKVRLLSLTDEFTGLPNRRAFMRRLEDEIGRVERYDIPLTMALIDLDHFKEINDEYGHPAGDEVLSWYARNALSTFRHCDMVARYGGEEFAVLFPNTTCVGALKALNKMRQRIEFAKCKSYGFTIKVPSFSAGLTVYQDSDTQESLIKRTDDALYIAKKQGRNRIEIVPPECSSNENK